MFKIICTFKTSTYCQNTIFTIIRLQFSNLPRLGCINKTTCPLCNKLKLKTKNQFIIISPQHHNICTKQPYSINFQILWTNNGFKTYQQKFHFCNIINNIHVRVGNYNIQRERHTVRE